MSDRPSAVTDAARRDGDGTPARGPTSESAVDGAERLRIARYRFRLARHGWARGDAGRRVAAAARRRLPSLVAERLAQVWFGADADVTEPVRVRLRVRLHELAAACESDEALATLVARLLPAEPAVPAARTDGTHHTDGFAAAPSTPGDAHGDGLAPPPVAGVARVLLEWRARGALAARLEAFAEDALDDWHSALVAEAVAAARPGPAGVKAIVRARAAPPSASRADVLRRRVLAAVEVLAQAESRPVGHELTRALDALLPVPVAAPPSTAPARPGAGVRGVPPAPRPGSARRPVDLSIESALPFLVLRPLERLGYLDALDAAFAAAGRRDDLAAFATALAYKVLAPPARGWRRDADAMAAAAAFAGAAAPAPEPILSALAAGAASLLSPLDGLVAHAVLAGHDRAHPVLLVATAGERLLLEPAGLFPIAWVPRVLTTLAGGGAAIAIAAAAVDGALLRDLDARGLTFVTDAPATRGERWRRLRHRRPLWTNDMRGPDDVLARAAAALDAEEDAVRLVEALAARRASTLDRAGDLDRSVALAAAVALGDLAWTLWREHEPTSPELALLRFADLSARVRVHDDALEVRLPLGARQRDLDRHGLLGEVRVPWLTGRVVIEGR